MWNAPLPRPIESYACVVFDCDGVILDSNVLKSEMMARALDGEAAADVAAFVAYHQAHGGVSRYVKFRHYFTALRPDPNPEPRIQGALARYAALLQDGLRSCPEIAGVGEMLSRLRDRGIPCFVNSGGDEAEVRDVLKDRGLAAFFAGIYGSPAPKSDNMARIRASCATLPALCFGDARSDLEAANEAGMDFVFVAGRSEWSDGAAFCRSMGVPVIENFLDLQFGA